MIVTAPILSVPLPVIAGAIAGAARHEILQGIDRLTRRWKARGTGTGIRSKAKSRHVLASLRTFVSNARNAQSNKMPSTTMHQIPPLMTQAIHGHEARDTDTFEPEKSNFETSEKEEIQALNFVQDVQLSSDLLITPELEKVFNFCEVKNNVKFSNAMSYWKQKTAEKIAEGSYGEIYKFRHNDGTERILKCIPINGELSKYENITLAMAVPEIVASKLLGDLSERSICAAPNFPTVHNICLVRDRFPAPLMKAWLDYKNSPDRQKDPAEHPPPDQYPESQLFLTIESSFCGKPLSANHLRNAWVGVTVMAQIVAALAAAEAAYNFEHRDLHLANILVRDTSSQCLYYSINNQHFSIRTVQCHVFIIDFNLSRIYNDQNIYYIGLDDIARDVERDPKCGHHNVWMNHKTMYKIMSECNKGRWDTYVPSTNIIWLKYMNENILDNLQRNHSRFAESLSPENEDSQLTALRLLRKWNDSILCHVSATDLLMNVICKDNPIVELQE